MYFCFAFFFWLQRQWWNDIQVDRKTKSFQSLIHSFNGHNSWGWITKTSRIKNMAQGCHVDARKPLAWTIMVLRRCTWGKLRNQELQVGLESRNSVVESYILHGSSHTLSKNVYSLSSLLIIAFTVLVVLFMSTSNHCTLGCWWR